MVVTNFPWLTVLVALPAAGAALLGFVPPLRRSAGRLVALAIALVELALGVYAAATAFNWSTPASYQLYESRTWIPQMGVTWSLGVTSLGLVMILLALALVPLVLIAGWDENEDRGAYPALVLALQAFMVLIFAAFDLAVFYFAFEAMLIPLYFMIGRYGVGDEAARHKAAMKFLLYSLFGGLIMLGGVLFIWALGSSTQSNTVAFFRMDTLAALLPNLSASVQMVVFVSFMVAFAIKAPMVPVHTWLPDTAAVARPWHVRAVGRRAGQDRHLRHDHDVPAAHPRRFRVGQMGHVRPRRYLHPVGRPVRQRPERHHAPRVLHVRVALGFMVLGIFIGSQIALVGAMFYMVAHGVSIAAMFLLSGWLSRRGGTQDMREYVGMQKVTPVLAGLWLMSGLASIALPGLSGSSPSTWCSWAPGR